MSLSGHCRHRWILFSLIRPSLPVSPPTPPLSFNLFLSLAVPPAPTSSAVQLVDCQIVPIFGDLSKLWLMVRWCRRLVGPNEALGSNFFCFPVSFIISTEGGVVSR